MPRPRTRSTPKKNLVKRVAKTLPSRSRIVARRRRLVKVAAKRPLSALRKPKASRPGLVTSARAMEPSRAPVLSSHAAETRRESPVPPSAPPATRSVSHSIPQRPVPREPFVIPTGYGDHRIVLMVKDPWWLHAYWEIDPAQERSVRSRVPPEEIGGMRSILRVYDVTGRRFPDEPANASWDIVLSGLANNWYVQVEVPGRDFLVDIGLLTKTGKFLLLVRSNRVTTPHFGPSDVIDEEWMVADDAYWRLFGLTVGVGMGASAGAMAGALNEQLARALFSAGMFSRGWFSVGKA